MVRRRGSNVTQNLKDYIVPIVGVFLIFLLIYSFFSGDSTPATQTTENRTGLSVSLDSVSSQGMIAYSGGDKKEIGTDAKLYKSEKILVQSGNIVLKDENGNGLRVSKNGDLKYEEDGSFSLVSADLWLDTIEQTKVSLRYANASVGEKSHVSFSQNEAQSTIYLLSGFAEVANKVGKSTLLSPGEKVVITRGESNSDDFDIAAAKQEIDEVFVNSDWFTRNNGSAYLGKQEVEEEITATGSTVSKTINRTIVLNNLLDESNVSSDTITISGNYSNGEVKKITLNGQNAEINTDNQSFIFQNVDTSQRENDLVFKVYDDANDLLEKFVYIVYYAQAASDETGTTSSIFSVKNYDVDGSQFAFTSPTSKNTLTTYESFVTFKGKVSAKGIASVTVNGYKLNSFKGSTWRYHADTKYNNLKNGTNVYEVKYFDSSNKLIYTNYYTIIKKSRTAPAKTKEVISGEANI